MLNLIRDIGRWLALSIVLTMSLFVMVALGLLSIAQYAAGKIIYLMED